MAVLGNCVKFADLGQLVDPVRLPADGACGFCRVFLRKRKASGTDLKADPRAAPRADGWQEASGGRPDGTQHRGGAMRRTGTTETTQATGPRCATPARMLELQPTTCGARKVPARAATR